MTGTETEDRGCPEGLLANCEIKKYMKYFPSTGLIKAERLCSEHVGCCKLFALDKEMKIAVGKDSKECVQC